MHLVNEELRGYTVDELIERLQKAKADHPGEEIRILMCTETKKTGQVEQAVADAAYVKREGRGGPVLILLPPGF